MKEKELSENDISIGQQDTTSKSRRYKRKETTGSHYENSPDFRALVNNIPALICCFDQQGTLTFANESYCKYFHKPYEKLVGENFFHFIPEEDRETVRKHFTSLTPENHMVTYEHKVIAPAGEICWQRWTDSALFDAEGMLVEYQSIGYDITAQKRVWESHKKNEALLHSAIESLPFDFFALEMGGSYMLQNSTSRSRWGNVIGKRPEDVAHDKDELAIWQDNNRRAFSGEMVTGDVELTIRGQKRYHHNIIAPIIDDGEITGILGVNIDITKHKLMEDAVRQSEEKYRRLFEMESDSLFLISNSDGQILEVNKAATALYGYSHEELLEKKNTDLSAEPQETRSATAYGLSCIPVRWHRKKDGAIFPVEIAAQHFTFSGKEVHIAAIRDITRRLEAERELQYSEVQYRKTLDSLVDIIVVVDRNLHIALINDACKKMCSELGLDPDIIGKPLLQGFPFLPHEVLKEYRRVFETGLSVTTEQEHIINGKRMLVETKKAPMFEGKNVTRVLTAIRDLTEQKIAEEEKKNLENRLQRAQKMEALGTLAGGVAHDLNNVLGGVVGFPDLLLMQLPQDSPLRKKLKIIKQSGEKAAAIVQDMLTLARRGVSTAKVVNLNQIIFEHFETPEQRKIEFFHQKVRFETRLDEDLLNILGSPVHLSKMVMNLLSNAAEAMPEGGAAVISTENRYVDKPIRGYDNVREGDYAVLTVSDIGVGIESDEIERIFEPFYTKKVMGRSGTGLGMAVVWGAVKDHKGYIDVLSEVGKGTTFSLYFPATRNKMVKIPTDIPIENYQGNGERILVVDDVPEQRDVAFMMLTTLGYSVTTVSSGEKAVEYIKSNAVDLILLDMVMEPGIDGLETYQRILQIRPCQRAIIVTGFSETERVKKAQELGAGMCIKKPYLMEKLGVAVRNELDRRSTLSII